MYYEIAVLKPVRLPAESIPGFSLSELSELNLLKLGVNVRRGVFSDATVRTLHPGLTAVGPRFGNITYTVRISEDQTKGELIHGYQQLLLQKQWHRQMCLCL